jgi:putative peptide zinc metalloprotease protein
MDLPRPSLVRQLQLHLSPEGNGFAYMLADRASGGILRLSRPAAIAYAKFSRAALGDSAARASMSEDEAKMGYMSLSMTGQMRKGAEQGPKTFNPLSIHLELMDVGPWQAWLQPIARWIFSYAGLAVLVSMVLLAILFGIRNDWSAATAFQNSMTLEAFLTFGLIAPFLKLIHELGHVAACTKYGVRVREGGLNIIGFYPMPFVDCSEADLIAQRGQRIMISATGVLTDFAVGLTAFLLWHVTENEQTRNILGYVFVFSTLNSLLFNANPLMRMDGYFAMSDALGRRNLGADSSQMMRGALAFVKTFGSLGELPAVRSDWALLVYGVMSSVYRIVTLLGILWIVLPQFFGLGVVAAIWGAYAMFGAKLLDAPPPSMPIPPSEPAAVLRKRRIGWGVIFLVLAMLAFLPISARVVVDLKPDTHRIYNITNPRAGVLQTLIPADVDMTTGQIIAQLANQDIRDAVEQADQAVKEAAIVNAIAQGKGAAEIKSGAERVTNAAALQNLAKAELAALTLSAAQSGRFTMTTILPIGSFLPQGSIIGQILPLNNTIVLTGSFPETHVTFYDSGLSRVDLWTGHSYRKIDLKAATLVEEVQQDQATQSRGFTLRIETDAAGLDAFPQVRLAFQPIAVWQHVAFWGQRKLAQFRDAQLAETERRIEN